MTRSATQGRTRRGEVRGQVLATVERLLEQGESFTALGVGRIADEAGVARSAFYTHFADKADLLMTLTDSATDELFAAASAWIHSDLESGVEALARTQLHSIGVFRRHAAVLAAYAEVGAYDTDVAEFWASRIEKLIDEFAERIERGQAAGLIKPNLAPRSTAMFLVWGAERTTMRHVRVDDGSGDRALATEMAEAVWAMLMDH